MDTMGRMIEFEYNPSIDETTDEIKPDSGRLINIRDFSEREIKYEYTDNGDLWKVDFEGRVKEYTYSAQNDNLKLAHNLQNYTDPRGNMVMTVTYNDEDKVLSRTNGDATISFLSTGPSAQVTDGRGIQSSFSHDDFGHALTIREGGNPATIFTYLTWGGKNEGLVESITYPEGNSVTYGYYQGGDNERRSAGNLLSITESPGIRGDGGEPKNSTVFTYDTYFNNVTSIS